MMNGASADELPAYSRRAPTEAEPAIPMRMHSYTSKAKLKLEVMSAGEAFLVLVQDLQGDKMWLEGSGSSSLSQSRRVSGELIWGFCLQGLR